MRGRFDRQMIDRQVARQIDRQKIDRQIVIENHRLHKSKEE